MAIRNAPAPRGGGLDDASNLQDFIDNVVVNGDTVLFQTGATYRIHTISTKANKESGLHVFQRSNLTLDGQNCTLDGAGRAGTVAKTASFFAIHQSSNITFKNATLKGVVNTALQSNEHRHVLEIHNLCLNITLDNITTRDNSRGGDGIYMNMEDKGVTDRNIVVKNCLVDNISRQGISITDGRGYTIQDTTIRNVIAFNLIDVEPLGGVRCVGADPACMQLPNANCVDCGGTKEPIANGEYARDITIERCLFGPYRSGLAAGGGPGGTACVTTQTGSDNIIIRDCTTEPGIPLMIICNSGGNSFYDPGTNIQLLDNRNGGLSPAQDQPPFWIQNQTQVEIARNCIAMSGGRPAIEHQDNGDFDPTGNTHNFHDNRFPGAAQLFRSNRATYSPTNSNNPLTGSCTGGGTFLKIHQTNVIAVRRLTKFHLTDVSVGTAAATKTVSHGADVLLRATLNKTHLTDVVLRGSRDVTHSTDVRVGGQPIRLYFDATGAAAASPAFATGWTDTTEAARRKLLRAKRAGDTLADGANIGPWAEGGIVLDRQYVSDPVTAQTISGNVRLQIRARELKLGDDATSRLLLKVVSGDGSTLRGTLLPLGQYGPNTEYGTASRNKTFADGDTMTPVACQDGDRIVVEIGHAVIGA